MPGNATTRGYRASTEGASLTTNKSCNLVKAAPCNRSEVDFLHCGRPTDRITNPEDAYGIS